MKKLLPIVAILALVMLAMGCMDVEGMIKNAIEGMLEGLTATCTIKASSTVGLNSTGLNSTGEYKVVSAQFDPETWVDFSTDSYRVEGEVAPEGPIEYTVDAAISVVGMFQKQGEDDALLPTEVWKGGELVHWSGTTSPWGAILAVAFSS
ncbi:MAG: hypothetical protein IMY79_02655 [Chloroflexi bacterium]|nr:hypothetical protein [Chloroflexota bacterium]